MGRIVLPSACLTSTKLMFEFNLNTKEIMDDVKLSVKLSVLCGCDNLK